MKQETTTRPEHPWVSDCKTGKLGFNTVFGVITAAKLRNLNWYDCPHCEFYHTTKATQR